MLKNMKIRSQIIFFTALILGFIILLQVLLYSILRRESNNVIYSFLNSVTQNTVMQIDNLNTNIIDSSSLLAVHPTVQACLYEYSHSEVIKNISSVQSLLNDYINSNKNISFLGIVKNNSLFMSSESAELYSDVRRIISQLEKPKNTVPLFMPAFTFENQTYFACITPIFPTNVSYSTPEHMGNFVVCIYKMDSISYAPYEFIDDSRISLVITDKENRIMLSADLSEHGNIFNFKEINKNYLHNTLPISIPNWNATIIMPSDSVSNFSNMSLLFITIMIFVTVGMLFLMLKLLNDTIIKRIVLLKRSVGKISDNDITYRVHYSYNDEFRDIVDVINRNLEKLYSLNEEKLQTVDSLYQAQLLQKETQIIYLYGQVSPHFLYNSLTYIQGIAFKYNATEIVHMISSLSKVFRYFSNNVHLSTIKQDMDCAIEYFNVINIRRKHPITLINNIDNSLLSVQCLKMIFQPILENVLKHAFSVDDSGTITISSVPDEKKAIIEIADNGCGINEDKLSGIKAQLEESSLNKLQKGEHIGLLNVNMRLKLYYNKECGIEIISKESFGTTIRIIFEKEAPAAEN